MDLATLLRRLRRDRAPHPPMPVLVGSPRSGTTMLRLMLDAHPQLAIPPETWFLLPASRLAGRGETLRERFSQLVVTHPAEAPAWRDFGIPADAFRARLQEVEPFTVAGGCRLFYRMYAERFGKPRWGDKTPLYCRALPELQKLLPEARFVHLVRDGRDAAADGSVEVSREERLRQQAHTLRPPDPAKIGVWKSTLTAAEAARLAEIAGDLLRHYGYQV